MHPYMKKLYVFLGPINDPVAEGIHESLIDLFCRPLDHLTDEYKCGLLMGMCSALTILLNQHGGDFNAVSLWHAYTNHYAKEG